MFIAVVVVSVNFLVDMAVRACSIRASSTRNDGPPSAVIDHDAPSLRRRGANVASTGWARVAVLRRAAIRWAPSARVIMIAVRADRAVRRPDRAPSIRSPPTPRASLARPAATHMLGADFMGRDMSRRIVYGARISLAVGVGATALGCMHRRDDRARRRAIFGGWFDLIVQRLMDIMQSLPLLVMALVMAAALGPVARPTRSSPSPSRWSRTSRASSARTRCRCARCRIVEAARAVGMSEIAHRRRHVLPNTLAPLIVLAHRAARLRHPGRGGAVLPRPRRAGAASLLGPHALGVGRRIRAHRALAGDLPRRRHQPRGVRHQPARRRAARHPRPAAAH